MPLMCSRKFASEFDNRRIRLMYSVNTTERNKSKRGATTRCRLMNPWPGKAVVVREAGKPESVKVDLDKTNGECLTFATMAGHKYLISPK